MPPAPCRIGRRAAHDEGLLTEEIAYETGAALGHAFMARSAFARTALTTLFGPLIGYLPDAEDFTAGGFAATGGPGILQMPPCSPALDDDLVTGAPALIESLER